MQLFYYKIFVRVWSCLTLHNYGKIQLKIRFSRFYKAHYLVILIFICTFAYKVLAIISFTFKGLYAKFHIDLLVTTYYIRIRT